jgi:LL-diaminopimelate aminotransferase
MIRVSNHLKKLPPYPFAKLEAHASAARARGEDVVDLSIGDPDLPPPRAVVEAVREGVRRQDLQGYSSSRGERFFREAVADWYAGRFGVDLDPDREVCCLIGSKEGLANLARAYVDPGSSVLCPDPGYPVYAAGATVLNGGTPLSMPLLPPTFLPDPDALDGPTLRLAYLNYPNNPTGAVVSRSHLAECVAKARENDILLAHDLAYSELAFDPANAPSILQVDGAKECAIEFHSLSKTFSMTGFRLGMAVGNADAVAALVKVKSQLDSGAPKFLQWAGAEALRLYQGANPPREVRDAADTYRRRLTRLTNGLAEYGLPARMPRAAFYLWHRVSGDGLTFAERLGEKNVMVTPGDAFGNTAREYVRWAVTQPEERIQVALEWMGDGWEVTPR